MDDIKWRILCRFMALALDAALEEASGDDEAAGEKLLAEARALRADLERERLKGVQG